MTTLLPRLIIEGDPTRQAKNSFSINEKTTLPAALTGTAFVGIAFYLAVELNVRLFFSYTRSTLYFWSCLLCSWGIILQNLCITLYDFNIWNDYAAIVAVTITWAMYVVPQSVVLYSRLEIVVKKRETVRWILWMILGTSVIFGVGTVVVALVARHPSTSLKLINVHLAWDKAQVTAFFIQETIISLVYIRETRQFISESALLFSNDTPTRRHLLKHLIYVNIFIVVLNCSLNSLCYAGYFFLQGHYKVAVYAIKLRTEFTILNQLRTSVRSTARTRHEGCGRDADEEMVDNPWRESKKTEESHSQDSDVRIIAMRSAITVATEIKIEEGPKIPDSEGRAFRGTHECGIA